VADPIRTSLPHLPQPRAQSAAGDAAKAAQRAFFAQALNGVRGQAPAEVPSAPARNEPARRATHVERINIPAEAPERTVRPGTYLDIKV